MIPLCNLHTHSTFCDGKQTPEENVLAAIDKGLFSLGFSSHAPYGEHDKEGCLSAGNIEAYRREILRLKEKYSDRIEILLGIEQDYFSPTLEGEYDYVIGSVHYIKKDGAFVAIDHSYDRLKNGAERQFGADMTELCREYYRTVADVADKTDCDIIGHFDIVTKFNEKYLLFDENDSVYRNMALEAVDTLLESDRIFEVNTGAVSRGWRKHPYPSEFIIKRIVDKKGRLMLTSDAHNAEYLTYGFLDAAYYLKALGVKELWIYKSGGYETFSL